MRDFKEVWYVWDEDDTKLGNISHFLLNDGRILTHYGQTDSYPVAAVMYTLGEKRCHVECCEYHGLGFYSAPNHFIGGQVDLFNCHKCSGTGKVWEYCK